MYFMNLIDSCNTLTYPWLDFAWIVHLYVAKQYIDSRSRDVGTIGHLDNGHGQPR